MQGFRDVIPKDLEKAVMFCLLGRVHHLPYHVPCRKFPLAVILFPALVSHTAAQVVQEPAGKGIKGPHRTIHHHGGIRMQAFPKRDGPFRSTGLHRQGRKQCHQRDNRPR